MFSPSRSQSVQIMRRDAALASLSKVLWQKQVIHYITASGLVFKRLGEIGITCIMLTVKNMYKKYLLKY